MVLVNHQAENRADKIKTDRLISFLKALELLFGIRVLLILVLVCERMDTRASMCVFVAHGQWARILPFSLR